MLLLLMIMFIHQEVVDKQITRYITVLAPRAMTAAQPPTRPATAGPPAGSVTDDDDRNQREKILAN